MSDALPHDEAAERAVLGACMESISAYRMAQGIVSRDDFFTEQHRLVWDCIGHWVDMGASPDVTLVLDRIRELKKLSIVNGVLLYELVHAAPIGLEIPFHAQIVADVAMRRRAIKASQSTIQRAESGAGDAADLIEAGLEELRAARNAKVGVELLTSGVDEFMAASPDRPEWVVPGLFCRGDRLVLTGPGGLGKSTLALQCVVLAAAGLPPLDWHLEDPFEPIRSTIVDCENPDHRVKTRVWPLLAAVRDMGHTVADRLTLGGHGRSLDVLDGSSALSLLRTVEHDQPDLVYIGPFYKLHNEDPDKEVTVKKVTHVLDQVREINGAALIIEAHHNKNGAVGGSLAPSGSNMWNWWPELGFGLRLDPDSDETVRRCSLERWRIDRDAFEWPKFIEHGGRFPWASSRPNAYHGLGAA